MCPPVAFPQKYTGFVSYEQLYQTLQQLINGSSPPHNVITNVDPFELIPWISPDDIWYFIHSKDDSGSGHGSWKAEGTNEVFSNSSILVRRTVHAFYEARVPFERKTAWRMHQFELIQKTVIKGSEQKERGMLCRIILDNGNNASCEKLERSSNPDLSHGTFIPLNRKSASNDCSDSEESTATKPPMNRKDETIVTDVADEHGNFCGNLVSKHDCFCDGDYLEIEDLDTPLSPSSCSDNSSCQSRSSEECFDSQKLWQDLDPKGCTSAKVDTNVNLFIAKPKRLSEVLVSPPTSGVVIEENLQAEHRAPDSNTEPKLAHEPGKSDIGPTGPSSRNASSSSSGYAGSPNMEKNTKSDRMKKLKKKYLCFMSF